jgi:hypothetical protein
MVTDGSSTRVAGYEHLPYELNAAPALHFVSLIADPAGSCLPFLLYSISHPKKASSFGLRKHLHSRPDIFRPRD